MKPLDLKNGPSLPGTSGSKWFHISDKIWWRVRWSLWYSLYTNLNNLYVDLSEK